MILRRSCLVNPGNRIDMIRKGLGSRADCIVIDLEDSVPFAEKEKARAFVREGLTFDFVVKERAVRINGINTPFVTDDVIAAVESGTDAIVIPKVESAGDIAFVENIINSVEQKGNFTKRVTLQALIETARGVQNIDEIAQASSRMTALIFGAADYSAEIGAKPLDNEQAKMVFLYPRSRIIIAAAGSGLDAIDSVYAQYKDLDGLKNEAQAAASMGFKGKWVIHPAQIEIANETFVPTMEELKKSIEMLTVYEEAKSKGQGAIVMDGLLVDEATVVPARKHCEIAEALGVLDSIKKELGYSIQ